MNLDYQYNFNILNWEIPNYEEFSISDRKNKYALIIPVINEGSRIKNQLQEISEMNIPVDVVISDGGSTDGSLEIDFLKTVSVKTLLIKRDIGRLSAQLRIAYSWSILNGYNGIITIDGNNKDGLDAIYIMLKKLEEGYDYVQGSRFIKGGGAKNTPIERILANRLVHAPILSLAGREWYTDSTNGFRGYSVKYLLDPNVQPFRNIFSDYELLFYLTVRAGQIGARISHVPVTRVYPKGPSVPTKIDNFYKKLGILSQTFRAAIGYYNPE